MFLSVNRKFFSSLTLAGLLVALVIFAGCWSKNINIPYYTQITSYYCGAASAQMILKCPKINKYVDQHTLYNYIHSHNQCSGWASGPAGLRDVLNLHYPAGHFIVHAPTSQNQGVKKQAYTIDKYEVPPAALIYGAMHWVVVRGVVTDQQPTQSSSYTIYGFYVNDPWYGSSSLGQNKYIAIDSWKTDYFNGTTAWCGAPGPGKKYISVVDPAPVPRVELKFPRVRKKGTTLISGRKIRSLAKIYTKRFIRQKDVQEHFPNGLRIVKTSEIGEPVLVNRSDRKRDAYYIVPFERSGLTTGAMLVNAYSGEFQEITFTKEAINYQPVLRFERAKELFMIGLPKLKKLKVEDNQNRRLKPIHRLPLEAIKKVRITKMQRVWEPSLVSQNPYYPIWKTEGKINPRSDRTVVLGYMDYHGKVYATLKEARLYGGGK